MCICVSVWCGVCVCVVCIVCRAHKVTKKDPVFSMANLKKRNHHQFPHSHAQFLSLIILTSPLLPLPPKVFMKSEEGASVCGERKTVPMLWRCSVFTLCSAFCSSVSSFGAASSFPLETLLCGLSTSGSVSA